MTAPKPTVLTKGDTPCKPFEIFNNMTKWLDDSELMTADHIALIARLYGWVFEDGTNMPRSELERWLHMGIIKLKDQRKFLVLPPGVELEKDLDFELLALWFDGMVDYSFEKGQAWWRASERAMNGRHLR